MKLLLKDKLTSYKNKDKICLLHKGRNINYSAQVRICNIDKEIRCGRYPSIQSLARQLEVSQRTIHRDIRPDPDFSYEDYIRNAFGIMRTDKVVHVAVQFRGYEARLARERSLHESQRTEEMPDGSVIIHLNVTGLEEVKRWVLSCGKDAKVLEPDWFALELKNEIEEMQKRYNQSSH